MPNDVPLLMVRLVDEKDESFRDRLLATLAWDNLASVILTLRDGNKIDIGDNLERNPLHRPVDVRIGKDFIEVDVFPAAGSVPIYQIVRFSEIISVEYF